MQAETLPPKRRASSHTSCTSAWLYVDAAPHARISTWQPGRSSYLDLSRVSRVPHMSFMPPCKRPRQWVHAMGSLNARAHAGIPSGVRQRRVTALYALDTRLTRHISPLCIRYTPLCTLKTHHCLHDVMHPCYLAHRLVYMT